MLSMRKSYISLVIDTSVVSLLDIDRIPRIIFRPLGWYIVLLTGANSKHCAQAFMSNLSSH